MLALLIIAVTSAWAQDEVTVNPTANANEWTLEMPDADVELEVTYYTDEELAEMEEAAFTAGVELTKASNGEWSLAEMPGFDVELEVEYETALALNEVDDNTAKLDEWNGYEADVTLTRTLQTGGWNTLAVPFSISAANYATLQQLLTAQGGNIEVKQLSSTSFENGTLTLNFTNATSIEAGKPYLVKVSNTLNLATLPATIDAYAAAYPGIANPFKGVIISKTAMPTETTYADFVPTLGLTEVTGNTENILFVASGNKLKYPETLPANMKGFRGYFLLKGDAAAQARSFSLNMGNEETGIETIDHSPLNIDHSVYDLQGRRIEGQPTQKGVYIVNGKKVFVR